MQTKNKLTRQSLAARRKVQEPYRLALDWVNVPVCIEPEEPTIVATGVKFIPLLQVDPFAVFFHWTVDIGKNIGNLTP